jgi:hypothetical protein
VTILAVLLFCGAPLGPKSLKRIPAVAPIATIAVIMTGLKSPRRSLLCLSIGRLANPLLAVFLRRGAVDQAASPDCQALSERSKPAISVAQQRKPEVGWQSGEYH